MRQAPGMADRFLTGMAGKPRTGKGAPKVRSGTKSVIMYTTAMPLRLYESIRASGSVPQDWAPERRPPVKFRVHNKRLANHLQQLRRGPWLKVLKCGSTGEVHYFEHRSGAVAGVKFIPRDMLRSRMASQT